MLRKQKLGTKIIIGVLGALLLLMPFAGCAAEKGKQPVVFADLNWDSARVHTRIAAFIMENGYGYPPSEFIPGETIPLFAGVAKGDLDLEMECWVQNQQEAYDKAIAAGDVIDLGINFPDAWQGWLVPTYMIEDGLLPEGVSVDDMPQYWELFKDPEDPTKGRFYNGPPGWESTGINTQKLEGYGLDKYYTNFLPGSDAALAAAMVAAYEKHEPYFGFYWAPTWVLGKLDMTPIEEPPYDEAVWEKNHGCAYPETGTHIVVNSSFPDRAPELTGFLSNYSTTAAQMNEILAYMEDNEASADEVAMYFLKNYESVWTKWVPADIADKVKAALP